MGLHIPDGMNSIVRARQSVAHGLNLIEEERMRQVMHHGWTPEGDDMYLNGELVTYAKYWLSDDNNPAFREKVKRELQALWPEGFSDRWFKYEERTYEERLARGGALLAAELDRVKRLLEKSQS